MASAVADSVAAVAAQDNATKTPSVATDGGEYMENKKQPVGSCQRAVLLYDYYASTCSESVSVGELAAKRFTDSTALSQRAFVL